MASRLQLFAAAARLAARTDSATAACTWGHFDAATWIPMPVPQKARALANRPSAISAPTRKPTRWYMGVSSSTGVRSVTSQPRETMWALTLSLRGNPAKSAPITTRRSLPLMRAPSW